MLLFFIGCDNINLFNLGNDISTSEEGVLPEFDCSDAQNISGAKNYQDFLAIRITPPKDVRPF